MEGRKKKVKYMKWGLANSFETHIEINERLKKDKRLRDYIVKHEIGHSDKFDLKHEFDIDWKIMPSLILFVLKNPVTWIDFLPIQIKKKRIIYDVNLLILYGLIILLSILLIIIIKK